VSARTVLRRHAGALLAATVLGIVSITAPDRAVDAVTTIGYSLREMLLVIPPIFVLLGLMDVWVPREMLIRYMGRGSGLKGTLIAFALGSLAAGPLYAAFPIAAVLMRKGSSFFNVAVFIGAWSTTKVPMFLFEYAALGGPFALTRLAANIPAILLIALVLSRVNRERASQTPPLSA
jgi:uncharacterized membrane protein YraQ (UPF0718 family)